MNTALTWLDLRHNRIGEGAVCIAEALRANRTLTHLNLSQNGLVADVLVRVMEVLAVCVYHARQIMCSASCSSPLILHSVSESLLISVSSATLLCGN